MRIVLMGPPGSGKGTQGHLICERLGIREIGTGDILRESIRLGTPTGKLVEPYLAAGQLVPDDLVNELVKDLIDSQKLEQFVMDGYPRTLAQAVSFDAFLKQRYLDLKRAILFSVSDEEVERRLLGRNQGRTDDEAATIRKRLQVYHDCTDDLVEYYRRAGTLTEIPALDTVEHIYAQVEAAVRG